MEVLDRLNTEYNWFTRKNIQEIDGLDCEELKSQLIGRNIALSTIAKYINGTNQIFDFARKQLKIIKYNPMDGLQVSSQSKPSLDNILRRGELLAVVEEIKKLPQNLSFCYLTAIYTGLRRGELCGLEWDKVSLEENVIDVSQTYIQDKIYEEGYHFKDEPKNGHNRYVPIFKSLKEIIEENQSLSMKSIWVDKDGIARNLLFCKADGSPFGLAYYTREWKKFTKQLQAKGITKKTPQLKDLRKSFITYMIRDVEMPLATVSMIASHRKTTTTEMYYLGKDKEDVIKLAEKYVI